MVAILVLLSALLHALWNAVLKFEKEKDMAAGAVVGVAAVAAVGIALVVWGIGSTAPFPAAGGIAWSVGAGMFEAAYFVLLVLALERAPLAVGYTVSRGIAIVAVWPISVVFLGETLTAASLSGSALLCVGLASSSLTRGAGSPSGIILACLCGLSIAGYHLCYKQALVTGAQPTAVFAVAMIVAACMNFVRLGRARLPALGRKLRERPWFCTLLGAMTATSFVLFLLALARGGAGFVLTLRNTSIVFAALIGWILGERPTRPQLIGATLVAAGAILVTSSR